MKKIYMMSKTLYYMVNDEQIIEALIEGLQAEPRKQGINATAGVVNFARNDNITLENNTFKNNEPQTVVISQEIQDTAVSNLNKLLELVEEPEENKSKISQILSWFEEKIPHIHRVLASLHFAQNL
jgi:hypothetical protein